MAGLVFHTYICSLVRQLTKYLPPLVTPVFSTYSGCLFWGSFLSGVRIASRRLHNRQSCCETERLGKGPLMKVTYSRPSDGINPQSINYWVCFYACALHIMCVDIILLISIFRVCQCEALSSSCTLECGSFFMRYMNNKFIDSSILCPQDVTWRP